MLKYPVALFVLIILGLGAWWAFVLVPQREVADTEPHEVATTTSEVSQWQWIFEPAGEDTDSGAPRKNVILRNGDTSYAIGAFLGSCFDATQSDWKLLTDEGELASAICWWAGGGNEIGVFSEDGKAVVRIGDVDEGTAEESGIRGNWRDLFEITFGFISSVSIGTNATSSILFDDALWLTGTIGEDAAIEAGVCTKETRSECLPNGFYIYNEKEISKTIPLASNIAIYMVTWHMEESGVTREYIRFTDFAKLINDTAAHWQKLPYNVTIKNNEVIMIEEVYVP